MSVQNITRERVKFGLPPKTQQVKEADATLVPSSCRREKVSKEDSGNKRDSTEAKSDKRGKQSVFIFNSKKNRPKIQ